MGCVGCGKPKEVPNHPLTWLSVRVWYADGVVDCATADDWSRLPDAILGAVGIRSNRTTDHVSGYDWYGWHNFPDGTWRVSGHNGDKAENDRQAKRHPEAIWKEGILVSDAEMERVSAAMREFAELSRG